MIVAPPTPDEAARIQELRHYDVLDTQSDEQLDNIVQLAAHICGAPIALVSLIDVHRQWFKAKYGLNVDETPRDVAFCAHAIHQKTPFIVPNALEDERFADNPLVAQDPSIRFYAGIPLESVNGYNLGTLCVIDSVPRNLSSEQLFALQTLSQSVKNILDLRLRLKITEKLNNEVQEKNEELTRQADTKRKILSVITHDLRSPIASLRSFLSFAEEVSISPEEFASIIADIKRRLNATQELIDDVFSWAEQEFSGETAAAIEIEVLPFLKQVVANFAIAAQSKNIAFEIPQDLPAKATFIPKNVTLILRNFIANALKFSYEGGKITVGAEDITDEQGSTTLRFFVKDEGVGMAEEQLQKLFNWGERYHTEGTAGEKGTGIGLLLCRDFARQHGGDIYFESSIGEGTKAILEIR